MNPIYSNENKINLFNTKNFVENDSKGTINGRNVKVNHSRSLKIKFEKIILSKDQSPPEEIRGSLSITQDDHHTGFLHVLIYVGQLLNAFFTGHKKRNNLNLCHGQVILGINRAPGKEGNLLLGHAVFGGVKTTCEDHKKDKIITSVLIYRPVDQKMRDLFARFSEQTAVNLKKAGLDSKQKDFKSRVKKEVGQFSITAMIFSVFNRQILRSTEAQQKHAAYAAADLLKEDKFRDEKGNLASFFCISYLLTLTQGSALVSALGDDEQKKLKEMSRDQIAQHLLKRIQAKTREDDLAAIYWENEFMQLDVHRTMSYFAGDVFDKASQSS